MRTYATRSGSDRSVAESSGHCGLTISTGKGATDIERYAAGELKKYLTRLYGIEISLCDDGVIPSSGGVILIGPPQRHGSLASMPWASPNNDGFWLKTVCADPEMLIIAGASDRGTLFGVYEFLQRCGMEFALSEEVYPLAPQPLRLSGFDDLCEPTYAIRAIRPMANIPEGAAPWGISDFKDFIDRMARMKLNTFVFVIMESGPWLDYEFRGSRRPAGDIFYGYRFPISDDFIGREHFGGSSEFYSPILAGAKDDQSRKNFGIEAVREIVRHCHERGLMTILTFSLLEPPTAFKHQCNEWASLPLPDPALFSNASFTETPAEELGINPRYAAWMNVLDPVIKEMIAHRLTALINTYPEADHYHLWVSEHRAAVVDCEPILKTFDEKYNFLTDVDWPTMLEDFASSPFDKSRYQNQLKGDLLFLHAFDELLNENSLLQRTVKPHASIGIAGIMPQLAPIVKRILPPGSFFVQFLDYGSHGPADQIKRILPLLREHIPTTLEIGIQDDNNMYFPQANVESLERIVRETAALGMTGYVIAIWQVRQSDIGVAYLARASWQPLKLDACEFYRRFLPIWVGPEVAEQFGEAHRNIESIDRMIRRSVLYGHSFLFGDSLIQYFLHHGVDLPAIEKARSCFQDALDLLESLRFRSANMRRHIIDFWIARTRFAIEWIDMAIACGALGRLLGESIQPGASIASQQKSGGLQGYDDLLSRSRSLIELIANDANHIGDLGQIANLNQHLHRYLIQRRSELASRQETVI